MTICPCDESSMLPNGCDEMSSDEMSCDEMSGSRNVLVCYSKNWLPFLVHLVIAVEWNFPNVLALS